MSPQFQEVFKTFNVAEADTVAAHLRGAGFHPEIRNDQSTLSLGWGAVGGGVRVEVPAAEYAEAIKLLESTSADEGVS